MSIIKDALRQIPQKDNNKVKILSQLRKFDRKSCYISPFLSISEGQIGRKENSIEAFKTIKDECRVLKKFFKTARLDEAYLTENAEYIAKELINHEQNYDKYDLFLKESSMLIIHPKKEEALEGVIYQLVLLAKNHKIPVGHPVFMCCISALYGNSDAQKIIKPKMNNYRPHNSKSDLLILTRINLFKEIAGKNLKIVFLTTDKPLSSFISKIDFIEIPNVNGSDFNKVTYSKKLFPKMTNEIYFNLENHILTSRAN